MPALCSLPLLRAAPSVSCLGEPEGVGSSVAGNSLTPAAGQFS